MVFEKWSDQGSQLISGRIHGGIGVVIRDGEGKFVVGLAKRVVGVRNLEIGEMIAARRALEFGAELHLSRFILEGDAKRVIAALGV
ncbi:hypothetical protein ACH5RR_006679 [Cinchona calisaya]|uniref:RNase H type-1 domain-containing protein n=1 Tax=Cinchona calisaya TaxID=153742 RepID=A0ABD3APQ8_9GENT